MRDMTWHDVYCVVCHSHFQHKIAPALAVGCPFVLKRMCEVGVCSLGLGPGLGLGLGLGLDDTFWTECVVISSYPLSPSLVLHTPCPPN